MEEQQQQQQQHISPSLLTMKVGRERCECEGDRQCCSLGLSVLNRRSNIRFLLLAALVISSTLVTEFRGNGGKGDGDGGGGSGVFATAMESAVNWTERVAKSVYSVDGNVRKMEGLMSGVLPTPKMRHPIPTNVTTVNRTSEWNNKSYPLN